jgi:hypothetical protein
MDAQTRFKTITMSDPDLNGLSDDEIDTWLELAAEELSASAFTANYSKTVVHLAAHKAKRRLGQDHGGGTPGAATSESVGDVSVSYEVGDVEDHYDTTTYGREYKSLLQKYVSHPV